MIYLTGDIHGDVLRLAKKSALHPNFTAADTVIVCGDFGLVWSNSQGEHEQLDFLATIVEPIQKQVESASSNEAKECRELRNLFLSQAHFFSIGFKSGE